MSAFGCVVSGYESALILLVEFRQVSSALRKRYLSLRKYSSEHDRYEQCALASSRQQKSYLYKQSERLKSCRFNGNRQRQQFLPRRVLFDNVCLELLRRHSLHVSVESCSLEYFHEHERHNQKCSSERDRKCTYLTSTMICCFGKAKTKRKKDVLLE